MSKEINERKSNFELLRIVSILLIILGHAALYGCQLVENNTINIIVLRILRIGAKLGVNCFVLTSGFFLIKKEFNYQKNIKLEIKILFYSIIILLLNYIFNFEVITFNLILESVFPVIFNTYWFLTSYVIMYFFSPFINKMILSLKKIELERLIMIMAVVLSLIPTLSTKQFAFSNVLWFINMYIVGAYIRLFSNNIFEKKFGKKTLFLSLTFIIVTIIAIIKVSIKYSNIEQYGNYFSGINKIPLVIASISLFCIFKKININNKFINYLSSSVIGVYLLHENPIMRNLIWNIQSNLIGNSKFYLILVFLSVVIVFTICILIDKICEFPIQKLSNIGVKLCNYISSKTWFKVIREE